VPAPMLRICLSLLAGCCFLICPSREEADKAVNACHNKKTLPGVSAFSNLRFSPSSSSCCLLLRVFKVKCFDGVEFES